MSRSPAAPRTRRSSRRSGIRYPVIRSRRSRLASVTARLPQILAKVDEAVDHLNDLLGETTEKRFL